MANVRSIAGENVLTGDVSLAGSSTLRLLWTVIDGGRLLACAEPIQARLPQAGQVEATDWADIANCLGGSDEAFARLVVRYQQPIGEQMWRFSRQRQVTEELVQEVFVEAFLGLGKFQGKSPFLHWLRKIATRVGYRYWKQEAKRRRRQTPLDDWQPVTQPTDQLAADDAAALVHQMLGRLAPRDRLVLTLIYLEGCSVAQASERTGWSQTMVKVQAFRARKKLKRILENAYGTDGQI